MGYHCCDIMDDELGLSKVMDSDIHGTGQRGDVEHKIRGFGETLLGTAIVYESVHFF